VKTYWVYVLGNARRTLYTGVTNDIERRLDEHRPGISSRFAARHALHALVDVEDDTSIDDAIAREKQIKGWGWARAKKIALIESANPD
jgi:putative endonuclease